MPITGTETMAELHAKVMEWVDEYAGGMGCTEANAKTAVKRLLERHWPASAAAYSKWLAANAK